MVATAGLDADFRFLVLAVIKQIERGREVLTDPSPRSRDGITRGDDYIDLLKSRIENRCFSSLHETPAADAETVNWIRAINVVTANLERIADFAVNMARQTQHFTDAAFLKRYEYESLFREVLTGVECIIEALSKRDSSMAFRICRADDAIDRLYQQLFAKVLEDLGAGGLAINPITALFIFHYLERMGDALRNIGEAVLSVVVGERLKVRQYAALREAMETPQGEANLSDVRFESIWGTRSGCRLGRVSDRGEHDPSEEAIFKDGSSDKLLREKEGIDRWAAVAPGLPPRVLQVKRDAQDATLMLQFLGGRTLQELVLGGAEALLDEALTHLRVTLGEVWDRTRRIGPVNANFLGQLTSRLDDVFRLHPQFRTQAKRVGTLEIPAYHDLLTSLESVNAHLTAPFSVLVHGDLNIDNIIYDVEEQKLHLIDLHRSREFDYVQDVSVFLASNFRQPMFDDLRRSRLNRIIMGFYGFARDFAAVQGDQTFAARLALAMARSFTSSTRFELNRTFAKAMHLRAVYLLERLRDHQNREWEAFQFPEHVLTS